MPRHPPCALSSLIVSSLDSCFTKRIFQYAALLSKRILPFSCSRFTSLCGFQGALLPESLRLSEPDKSLRDFSGSLVFGHSSASSKPFPSISLQSKALQCRGGATKRCAVCSDAVVGSSGLEPPTSRLSGVRSNRLSYEPTWWR